MRCKERELLSGTQELKKLIIYLTQRRKDAQRGTKRQEKCGDGSFCGGGERDFFIRKLRSLEFGETMVASRNACKKRQAFDGAQGRRVRHTSTLTGCGVGLLDTQGAAGAARLGYR